MFKEWKDSPKTTGFLLIVIMLFWLFVGFLYVTFPEQRGTLNFYTMLLTMSFIVIALDYGRSGSKKIVASNNFGVSFKGIVTSFAIGAAVGAFLVLNPFSSIMVSIPYPLTTVNSFAPDWNFFYINIASPLAETLFFVNVLPPTLIHLLAKMRFPMPDLSGIGLTAATFSLYHFNAYGGDAYAMLAAGLACMVWIVLGYMLKNNSFGLAAHISNNYLVWLRAGGVL